MEKEDSQDALGLVKERALTHTGGLASAEASGNPAQHEFLGEVIERM